MKFAKSLLTLAACAALASTSHAAAGKWVSLYNGKDTSNWNNPYDWGEITLVGEEIHLTANK